MLPIVHNRMGCSMFRHSCYNNIYRYLGVAFALQLIYLRSECQCHTYQIGLTEARRQLFRHLLAFPACQLNTQRKGSSVAEVSYSSSRVSGMTTSSLLFSVTFSRRLTRRCCNVLALNGTHFRTSLVTSVGDAFCLLSVWKNKYEIC